jgi:hypothetical protein
MRLPFGIDLKSLIIGGVLVYFVLPWILGMVSSRKSVSTSAS